jgi:2-polyprenyl-6-methoxyphenol hydroxylase-like FAD-dependent oxidoreductase
LIEHLRKQAHASLRFAHEWEAADQDAGGVTSRVREVDAGRSFEVRSRWLLAADGAGSRVRKALGIEPIGPPRLASFVMIHFEANLSLVGPARNPTSSTPARLLRARHRPDWPAHLWDLSASRRRTSGGAAPRRAIIRRDLIRTLGVACPQVAERYRERRFLIGDAAHRFRRRAVSRLNTGAGRAQLSPEAAAVEGAGAAALSTVTRASEVPGAENG